MCAAGTPRYSEAEMNETVQVPAGSGLRSGQPWRHILCPLIVPQRNPELPGPVRQDCPLPPGRTGPHRIPPPGPPARPRNLWLRKMDHVTGEVTITNTSEDPWDVDVLLLLPDGASPVDPETPLMNIYTAMIIGERARERDFSDQDALARCQRRRPHRHNLRPGKSRGSSAAKCR